MQAWDRIKSVTETSYGAFVDALTHPVQTQQIQLEHLLKFNANTEFGRKCKFDDIRSREDFRDTLPIHSYQDFKSCITRMAAGESGILVNEDLMLFEETTGMDSDRKLIPYTNSSLNQFRAGLLPWIHDLCRHYPKIMNGTSYWSISPVIRKRHTSAAGVAIGIENDALYFGEDLAANIAATLAVPPSVAHATTLQEWQHLTLCYLLADKNLSLISIWSPTFLLDLFKSLSINLSSVLETLYKGQENLPFPITSNPDRCRQIEAAFDGNQFCTEKLWPKLQLISCWASASSAAFVSNLKNAFPHAELQPKGLLATEGLISFPLVKANGHVLAINSGYFEFIGEDDQIYFIEELEVGAKYSILLSNFSGLYRYSIGDNVLVTGKYLGTPCIEFVGRDGNVSDICGEKLTEHFVNSALYDIQGFKLLVPRLYPQPGYVLYTENSFFTESEIAALEQRLENRLQRNVHYQYARRINQLSSLVIKAVNDPQYLFTQHYQNKKIALGDLKFCSLSTESHWHELFREALV